jgi:squalene-hopene/tetraprenyl-beta-curcumene cyclase
MLATSWCVPVMTVMLLNAPPAQQREETVDKGLRFLVATVRPDGGWAHGDRVDPAVTALAAQCLIQSPHYGPSHPVVKKALARVAAFTQPDGGIYPVGPGLRNYYTSVALMALSASGDPRYAPTIANAQKFLQRLQWDEDESIDTGNPWYGGAGYGKHKRPDLSNTQMMIEALKRSGLPPTDPAYKKAIKFIERCQMLSAVNDQPLARGATDGGFVYSPAKGGESKAGTVLTEQGQPRLRTYGSMTYAGFKSYLYANVDRNDPRVQAALKWIRNHYTLDHNPNMPDARSQEGLYYYYQVFAKAMQAWGEPQLIDAKGIPHDWRAELTTALATRQRPDGSWINEADRWYEHNPYLVTAYAVLALQATQE